MLSLYKTRTIENVKIFFKNMLYNVIFQLLRNEKNNF